MLTSIEIISHSNFGVNTSKILKAFSRSLGSLEKNFQKFNTIHQQSQNQLKNIASKNFPSTESIQTCDVNQNRPYSLAVWWAVLKIGIFNHLRSLYFQLMFSPRNSLDYSLCLKTLSTFFLEWNVLEKVSSCFAFWSSSSSIRWTISKLWTSSCDI